MTHLFCSTDPHHLLPAGSRSRLRDQHGAFGGRGLSQGGECASVCASICMRVLPLTLSVTLSLALPAAQSHRGLRDGDRSESAPPVGQLPRLWQQHKRVRGDGTPQAVHPSQGAVAAPGAQPPQREGAAGSLVRRDPRHHHGPIKSAAGGWPLRGHKPGLGMRASREPVVHRGPV